MVNREPERKRLTTDKKKIFVRECPTIMSVTKAELHKLYIEIFDRLQEYEVAEETGQIIVPPVKVGQTVYSYCEEFCRVFEYRVANIHLSEETTQYEAFCYIGMELADVIDFDDDDIGKTVFTSREDAVKALEGKEDEGK